MLITNVVYGSSFVVPSVSGIAHLNKRANPINRKSSYPYITGDTFRSICDFIIDEERIPFNPELVKDGDIVFLNADYMDFFFSQIHDRIKACYILLTHNSDVRIPGKYIKYLDDEKLITWFGQNVGYVHPKLVPIPIGMANAYLPHGNTTVVDRIKQTDNKTILLYLNVLVTTNASERNAMYHYFKAKSFCTVSPVKSFHLYLNDLAHSKFVLSPPGNGYDCHRTWESLYMGTFPIVKSSVAMDSLYEGLPVIIISDWKSITKEFLEETYQTMLKKEYNLTKLYADYWIGMIKDMQKIYRKN